MSKKNYSSVLMTYKSEAIQSVKFENVSKASIEFKNVKEKESEKPSNNNIKRENVERAFIRMLSRVGGGYKFKGWLGSEGRDRGRSDLSKQTDADTSVALYGSDYKNQSHIVGYVGVTRIDGALRIKAEIDYYEDIGSDILSYVGTAEGKTIASDSSPTIMAKSFQHKGMNSLEMLYNLIERFDKNIAQF
jgi:hypothetical protein